MEPTRLSESPPDPFVGRTFDGYRVEELIGRGGMGEVYRATQLSLNRSVALKVLPHALLEDRRYLDRFEREVDILSRLSHPNIVTVMERGEIDGRPYVVMEFVNGTSLRDVMKRGPVPPAEALAIVRGVLGALEHAHRQGVIHRDIKPENVLLAPGGVVKVADFGLSRIMEADITRLTRSHVMLGTFEYMSPEQREQARDADERSDLYSTGVVLYEMIAGELPIGHFDALSKKRPAECDSRIDEIVERSMKKHPDERFQEAASMGEAVSRLLSSAAEPVVDRSVPAAESVPADWRTPRVYTAAAAFLVVLLVFSMSVVGIRAIVVAAVACVAMLIPWQRVRTKHVLIVGGAGVVVMVGVFVVYSSIGNEARAKVESSRRDAERMARALNRPIRIRVATAPDGVPHGVAQTILADRAVSKWIMDRSRPSWRYPEGVSVESDQDGIHLVFDRLVTKAGYHRDTKMNVEEARVAAAYSFVLAQRVDAGVVRECKGDEQFEQALLSNPPPAVK